MIGMEEFNRPLGVELVVAVGEEELRPGWCHIEMIDEMGADLGAVIEPAVHVEREGSVDALVVLVEPTPNGEVAARIWQCRVERFRHELAGLGERGVDSSILKGGDVLNQVVGDGDLVERTSLFAGRDDIDERLRYTVFTNRLGHRRSRDRRDRQAHHHNRRCQGQ